MWLFFLGKGIAHSKKSSYLCIAYHSIQANVSPTTAVGIFYAVAENNNSSVPCGALMRPQPVLGGKQRGAELFSSPVINKYIVSF
ncbi:MAG: hypothetical protein E7081_02590 [Bacteroidales bacterium]|nr:hypothetical protein [Bacteroidales bacterium]